MATTVGKRPGPQAQRIKQQMGSPNPPLSVRLPEDRSVGTPPPNLQWPVQKNMPTLAPYPAMPVVPNDKPLLTTYGATGTAIFSGILQTEEYNPDFYWRDGTRIYEQMLRSDSQISAIRQMIELPIRRAKWFVKPASDDPRDQEIASFVESCLFHDMKYQTSTGRWLYQKWDDILRHALMSLWHGFAPFEVCWRIEDKWVKWAQWLPLLPRTIWRWWVGDDNELAGLQQWTFKDYTYQFREIPADKLLLFIHRQEGNNYEGLPLLRTCYPDWFFKQQYRKIQAIGIERNAVVPPVIYLPPNHTPADVNYAQTLAQNLRVNELMGATLPHDWKLEYPRNQEKQAESAKDAIDYCDVMMARNIMAQFINLGSSETGSYSQDRSQKLTFLSAIQTYCEYFEDVINSDAIPRLVNYNYDGVEVYPQLQCTKILAQDLEIISDAIKNLGGQSKTSFLNPTPQLEEFLGDLLGIPVDPQSAITTTDPTSPMNPAQPEQQQQQPNAEPQVAPGSATPQQPEASAVAQASQMAALFTESLATIDAVERGSWFRLKQEGGQP